MDLLIQVLSEIVTGVVTQRFREENDRKEWALISKEPDKNTGKRKILYWFGVEKPSEEKVLKQERRVQFFKHKG